MEQVSREQAKEQIKRSISCTDYLEKSKNNMYCCPACGSGHGQNGTGAVKYYRQTNTWHCHACNTGGDVIDAYTAATGGDYNTALSYLAAQIGIDIAPGQPAAVDFSDEATERPQSDFTGQQDKQADHAEKSAQSEPQPRDFTGYYKECCSRLNDPAAISYLQARGISEELASRFNIGFDPEADPANNPGAPTGEYKAHATPRIIIPCSLSHYVARSIDPNTPQQWKALNPKKEKGGGEVALFNAAAINSGAAVIFVTEGIFDALSFIAAGEAAIALNAKGNSKLLLQHLQENPTEAGFVIVPDNDENEKTAADTLKRAKELNRNLQAMGQQSIVYNVAGDQHDANDALLADRAAFEKNIAASIAALNRDELDDFLEKIQTEAYKPYSTGLNFFDNLLGGGIIQQSLMLLMAAPGAGKTTLAQQIAETMAKNKKPVIYFNFEMSREQMLAKAISARLYHTDYSKSTTGVLQGYNWTEGEREQITRVIEEYRAQQYPYIQYNPADISPNLDELLAYLKARGEQAKAKGEQAPAAVIDYLHLITGSGGIDLQELIKQAVTGLKEYAIEYNTFVIAITATNRESNKRGRITADSGRDSSGLEYTADYQISLNYFAFDRYAIDKDDPAAISPNNLEALERLQQEPTRHMILRVLKNRFAQPGRSAEVTFNAALNTFYGTWDGYEISATDGGFILDKSAPDFDDDGGGEATTLRI